MRFERLQVKDYITLASAGFGFLAIYFAFKDYVLAALFVVIAVALDFLDGHVARRFGKPNAFGRELDSLSDAVAFGVAPAVAALRFGQEWFYVASAVVYVWAVIVRLARFNLYASEGKYYGLPAPAAALLVVFLAPAFGAYAFVVLLVLAFLMLGDFEVNKLA